MARRIMLVPISTGVGLTSVSVGLVRALEQKTVKVNFFKPIAQPRAGETGPEKSTQIVTQGSPINPPTPFALDYAEQMIGDGKGDDLLEEIVERFQSKINDDEVAIIEGMVSTRRQPYAGRINSEIAQTLGADIVFVLTPGNYSITQIEDRLEIAAGNYGGIDHPRVLGCIFNKVMPL